MASNSKKDKLYHCGMCGVDFQKRTFSRHKLLFYDFENNAWKHHEASRFRARAAVLPKPKTAAGYNPFQDISSSSDSDDSAASRPSEVDDRLNEVTGSAGSDDASNGVLERDHADHFLDHNNLWEFGSDEELDDVVSTAGGDGRNQDEEHSGILSESEDDDIEVIEDSGEELDDVQPTTPSTGIRRSRFDFVNTLLFYLVYFILYWQASVNVSDNAVEWLLRFHFQLFSFIGCNIDHQYLSEFAVIFPTSMYMLRQLAEVDRDDFIKYVVCPKCTMLYTLERCTEIVNGVEKGKLCNNKVFGGRGQGRVCNSPLVKQVFTKLGRVRFYPIKVFCFKSIINDLERILQRNGIPELCDEWKNHVDFDIPVAEKVYRDIYDGAIWKEFQSYNREPFLANSRNLGLMMNIDWFQPFDNRSDYSVGVIYFVVMNLPRDIRFKMENVIVAGMVPALDKEPASLKYFFEPIVKELQALWRGVRLQTSLSSIPLLCRAALLSVVADIPAARKACGFKSHAGEKGCSKCYKTFPGGFAMKRDYSGFERQTWPMRTKQLHNRYARLVKNCKTVTDFNNLSRQYGTYYSVLIELDYFDAVRFCVVDGMHNLFLGTAKKMFKMWVEQGFLNKEKLSIIVDRISAMTVPSDIGRIPSNISSNYGSYTAAEWKNWTTVFSLYALHGQLDEDHFRCWEKFVLACRLLSGPTVSHAEIIKADLLLLNFCKKVEELYGTDFITPNMHLHCHLKECLLDFGSMQSFWCFPFERYNGYLGNFTHNNRCVEIQFMRKINVLRCAQGVQLPEMARDEFAPFFDPQRKKNLPRIHIGNILNLQFPRTNTNISVDWLDYEVIKFPSGYKYATLSLEDDIPMLKDVYKQMYPDIEATYEDITLSEVVQKFGSLYIAGERYGSKMENRTLRSARVVAAWVHAEDGSVYFRPCRVNFYFSHVITLNGIQKQHYFANVSWYRESVNREQFSQACQIWQRKEFELGGHITFLPIQRILCRFAYADLDADCMAITFIPRHISS